MFGQRAENLFVNTELKVGKNNKKIDVIILFILDKC